MPRRDSQTVQLVSEEQLLSGVDISEVTAARDQLKATDPDCLLVQLVDAKLALMLLPAEPPAPRSPWAA